MYNRSGGILLSISSLPGRFGIGCMGKEAYAFVDFLHDTHQQLWQILPLNPPGGGNSPYQSFSAFAGNILLICPDKLREEKLLKEEDLHLFISERSLLKIDYEEVRVNKMKMLKKAYILFKSDFEKRKEPYSYFLGENSWWLNDYSLFQAIKEDKGNNFCWNEWEDKIKHRDRQSIDDALLHYSKEVEFQRFLQYIFFKQWFELKKYANKRGVKIIGDLPLYLSMDSSDVWSNQDMFLLDENGNAKWMGGVPPDYFSETGQMWGNPVYNWDRIKERNFDWWIARIHFNLKMFDIIRIDHFRGLESFWAIPAGEKTAENGKWMKAKGEELLEKLESSIGNLPIIAEDLGIITPEVEKLRDKFHLPGMKVLQFAFSSDEKNSYLPHNYTSNNSVVYTGTHDNNTTIGWLKDITHKEQENLKNYYSSGWTHLHKKIIETAWSSVSRIAIVPMQDLLELDSRARMNIPGTIEGNWQWRFDWRMMKKKQWKFLRKLTKKYNRYRRKKSKE